MKYVNWYKEEFNAIEIDFYKFGQKYITGTKRKG